MKNLIFLVLGLSILGGCKTSIANDFVVRDDLGGGVLEYINRTQELHGRRIVIDGKCYSACMIYLSSGNACATDRADLGFHGTYFVEKSTKRIKYSRELKALAKSDTEAFLDLLPIQLETYIRETGYPSVYDGDDSTEVLRIQGQKAIELLGKC